MPRRIIDFKIILWIIAILFQYVGDRYLWQHPSVALAQAYTSLIFEFTIIYGMLLLLNFLIRQLFVFGDTRYHTLHRLNLTIRFQYIIDIICSIIVVIYLIVGSSLFL